MIVRPSACKAIGRLSWIFGYLAYVVGVYFPSLEQSKNRVQQESRHFAESWAKQLFHTRHNFDASFGYD